MPPVSFRHVPNLSAHGLVVPPMHDDRHKRPGEQRVPDERESRKKTHVPDMCVCVLII